MKSNKEDNKNTLVKNGQPQKDAYKLPERSALLEQKRLLRRNMSVLRGQLDSDKRRQMDRDILSQILNLPDIQSAKTVYTYVSYGSEADTRGLMEALWARGVAVATPRVEAALGGIMRFYLVRGWEDLRPGFHDILEPVSNCPPAEEEQAPVITPGLAFSRRGARLGYGGGFYDRFFAAEPRHMKIAVAYPFQVFETLPVEQNDLPVDVLVVASAP